MNFRSQEKQAYPPIYFLLILLLILAATWLIYGQARHFEFVNWDDDLYVYNNPYIGSWTLGNIKAWFTRSFVGLYVPLPMMSYALDFHFYGLDAGGFHLTNVLLHGVNGLLVFGIFLLCFQEQPLLCLLGTLLFVVHPAQADSVLWISQRKNLLFAFFFLLGFFFALLSRDNPRARKWLLTAMVVCFFASLMSKATAVIIPVIMINYAYFFGGLGKRNGAVISLFMLVPAAAIGLFTLTLYPEVLHMRFFSVIGDLIVRMFCVLFFYFKMMIWPSALDLTYDASEIIPAALSLKVLLVATAAGLAAVTAFLTWKRRAEAFWLVWIFLFLLPVANLFPVPVANRHLYIPLVGAIGVVIAVGTRFRMPAILFLTAAVLFAAPACWSRGQVWKNSESLWQSVTTEGGFRVTAGVQLANYYEDRGNKEAARKIYLDLIKGYTHLPYPYFNLYNMYKLEGDEAAADLLEKKFAMKYSSILPLSKLYAQMTQAKNDPEKVNAIVKRVIDSHRQKITDREPV